MTARRPSFTGPTPWGLLILLGGLTAVGPLAIDMYLPGLPAIARGLHASPSAVSATLAACFAGLGFGQFVFGPLSDRFGRRPPLVAGVSLFLAGSIACAYAPSVSWLIAARFVQALGGSAGQVIARAAVRDRFPHQMAARVLSLLLLVMGLAPIIAPIFGGYLLLIGWRAIFWFQTLGASAMLASVLLGFEETRPPEARANAGGESVWRAYHALFAEPRVVGYALAGAFNAGAMFSWIALASYLLIEVYGVAPQDFGWWFSANAVAFIGASQINAHLLRWRTPEDVLVRARPISVVFSVIMVVDAWTGLGGMLGVLLPIYVTIGSFGLVGPNTQAAAMNVDPERAGAISSIIGASAFGMGTLVSAIAGYLHDGTARPMSVLILAMILASSAALYLIAKPTQAQRLA